MHCPFCRHTDTRVLDSRVSDDGGAIRRRQSEAARARMMADVPEADVVVTNPTHYAVALKYSPDKPAPVVNHDVD